ncbi:hypothetical protein O181_021985 [Austropuccinia psidii MF-1]|uniref:Uncharacterized protein n=1 Tax=Austropuccinia psidii MF-1 TaxID=1389203 RepID=A0A9Q3CFL8_9BASI|nr:hypothetical protein [Austropuccinia psidii MF-1]
MSTFQNLQPFFSFSRRREERFPFPFPDTQVVQRREQWPVCVTQQYPNMVNEGKYSLAKLLRRVDRNSREIIMYANDRMIPGTASEEMGSKFVWYKDELINDLQRTIDDLGRDN